MVQLSNIWFLSYVPKTAKQIRMQDSLTHNISQNNLRYEIEFLDMIKGPRKHEILLFGCFKWVCSVVPGHAQREQIVSQLYLKNELSYEASFLHVVRKQ